MGKQKDGEEREVGGRREKQTHTEQETERHGERDRETETERDRRLSKLSTISPQRNKIMRKESPVCVQTTRRLSPQTDPLRLQ